MADSNTADSGAALAVKPEAGKLSADDKMRFGPARLSYLSAQELAKEIASSVKDDVKGKTVVIAGTTLIADFANLQMALLALENLELEYSFIARYAKDRSLGPDEKRAEDRFASVKSADSTDSLTDAVASGNPIVAAALGVLGLLQGDVEFHGVETKIDRLAFELAVAAAVKDGTSKVCIPDLMLKPLPEAKDSRLRALLAAVGVARSNAWKDVAPLIKTVLDAEVDLEKAKAAKNKEQVNKCQAKLDEERRKLEPINSLLIRADQLFDNLQAEWRKPSEGEQISSLSRMFRIEAINRMEPVYLHCAIVDSGGHHRLSRSLWNFLLADDGFSFSGGAIARWALLDAEGGIGKGGVTTRECNSKRRWLGLFPWTKGDWTPDPGASRKEEKQQEILKGPQECAGGKLPEQQAPTEQCRNS